MSKIQLSNHNKAIQNIIDPKDNKEQGKPEGFYFDFTEVRAEVATFWRTSWLLLENEKSIFCKLSQNSHPLNSSGKNILIEHRNGYCNVIFLLLHSHSAMDIIFLMLENLLSEVPALKPLRKKNL